MQFTVKEGLNSNRVWCILEDKKGHIWIGTEDGICRWDGKTFTRIPITLAKGNLSPFISPINSLEKNEVFSMLQDKNSMIWFGTSTGVYRYDGKSFTRFTDQPGLINKSKLNLKSVQCMLQDRKGNIWFGSGPMAFEGIVLYDGKSLVNFKPKEEGWIRNILEDKNGDICFGTRHYGACCYDGKTFFYFTGKSGIGNPLLQDTNGNIWFSGEEKLNTVESVEGIWRYDGKNYKNVYIKDGLGKYSAWSMLQDKSGNIWVGTRNNGLYRYDGKKIISFSE